ncbi:MAG: hypothetical protein ACLTKT_05565 [Clostridia bacterium]|nr:hypothetical protein [Clostridium sp.]MBS6251898.1 hypothetical protein [Clostridium sp.]
MKKLSIVKGLLIALVSLSMLMFTTNFVSAADEGYVDVNFDNTASSNSSSNKANTNSNKTNTNSSKNKANTNSNSSKNSNSNSLNTNGVRGNNVSSYNNTSLPKTGLQESLPVVLLVVVFGISAVYAYKKIKDYRNI